MSDNARSVIITIIISVIAGGLITWAILAGIQATNVTNKRLDHESTLCINKGMQWVKSVESCLH